MPELLLMRHAKSDRSVPIVDRDRPLAPRGERAASAIGRTLTDFGVAPDLVLTSPARRAATTAELAAASGGWSAPIRIVDAFYGGGVRTVVEAASAAWDGDRVMAVGHEPTWSETVAALVGGGSFAMVTGAVACLEFYGPLRPGGARLLWMLNPRLVTE